LLNAVDALEQKMRSQTPQERNDDPSQITLRTTLLNDEQYVQIVVIDNGTGMPQEIRQQIFDPFFTTKPIGKGTGLGLSISYQIITERHDGKLECFSSPDEGTEFVIHIPINAEV
ncbi:MAG: ATP-binding protein, partial [Cyanobacteria bacterium J06627_8]